MVTATHGTREGMFSSVVAAQAERPQPPAFASEYGRRVVFVCYQQPQPAPCNRTVVVLQPAEYAAYRRYEIALAAWQAEHPQR